MESNREEAVRCVRIAMAAAESGDKPRARKFLSIAQRLRPEDPDVLDLLAKLGDGSGPEDPPNPTSSASSSSKRNGEHESEVKDSASSTTTDPTSDQVEIVRRINRTVDYYEILAVKKDCSEEDVRKAYRKLSLKVHPDKNKAKGAEEAFKSVSRAFQCLSNVELRERYDRYGPENVSGNIQQQQQQGGGARRRRHGGEFFDDGFDPDEIFQAFFFGNQPRQFHRQQQHPQYNFVRTGGGQQSFNLSGVIHLVLIFVVILLTSFPFNSQPSYFSLERESPYLHQLRTGNRAVPYYVRSATFGEENPVGSKVRNQVEAQVEREYRDVLLHNCRVELNMRAWGKISETPNCKKLESFQQRVY